MDGVAPKMKTQLNPGFKKLVRFLGALVVVGALAWAFITYVQPMLAGKTDKLALNGWAGFIGIHEANGGMKTDPNSEIGKLGGKWEIVKTDVRKDALNLLVNGEITAAWVTTDVFPTEIGAKSNLAELEVVQNVLVDMSRGADRAVFAPHIKKISDLKGKKVVFGRATASHTLLITMLESAGMTMKDIVPVEVSDGIEASKAYQAGGIDAAVVWSPDDGDCIKAVPGSWVGFSTAQATSIIMDGILVKRSTLEDKTKMKNLTALVKGMLNIHARLNTDVKLREKASSSFAASFGMPAEIVLDGANQVRFATYGDNLAFFGLDPTFKGVTGSDLYNKMAGIYSDLKDNKGMFLADSPLPWAKVSDTKLIENLGDMKTQAGQEVEGQITFAPIGSNYTDIATRPVTVNFETSSAILDAQNQALVDAQIGRNANSLGGARFEIVGNTDNVGSGTAKGKSYNKQLSLQRAQSIVNYLVKRYKFSSNKFVVRGDGDSNPVMSNDTEAGRAANRRTDVKIITEVKPTK